MDGTLSKDDRSAVKDLRLKTSVVGDEVVKDGKMNPSPQHPGPNEKGRHDGTINNPSSNNSPRPTTPREINRQPNIQLQPMFSTPPTTATIPKGQTPISRPHSWATLQELQPRTKSNSSVNQIAENEIPYDGEERTLDLMEIRQDEIATNGEEDIYNALRGGDITSNSNIDQPPSAPSHNQLLLEYSILAIWFLTTLFLLAMTAYLAWRIDWRGLSFITAAPINWFSYPLTLTQAKGVDFLASAVLGPVFIAFSDLFYINVARRLSHPSNSSTPRPEAEEENTNNQSYISTKVWSMVKSSKPRQVWTAILIIATALMGSCLCNVVAYQAVSPGVEEEVEEMMYAMAYIPGLLLGSLGSMTGASGTAFGLVLHARKPVPTLDASRLLVDVESQSQIQVQTTPRAWKTRSFSLPSFSTPTLPSLPGLTVLIWKRPTTSSMNEISETSPLLAGSSSLQTTPSKPRKKASYLPQSILPNWNRRQRELAKARIQAVSNVENAPPEEEIAVIKGISASEAVKYIQDQEAAAEQEVGREENSSDGKLTWFRLPRLSWNLWISRPHRRSTLQWEIGQFMAVEEGDRSSGKVKGKTVEHRETRPLLGNALKNGESSCHGTFRAEMREESSKVETLIGITSDMKAGSALASMNQPEGQREDQGPLSHHKTKGWSRQRIPRKWNAFRRETLPDIESDAALLTPDNDLHFEPVTVNERESLLQTVHAQHNFPRLQRGSWSFSFPWILPGFSSPGPSPRHNGQNTTKGKGPIRPHLDPGLLDASPHSSPENTLESDIGYMVPRQALEKEIIQDPQRSLGKHNPPLWPMISNLNKPGESSASMGSHTSGDLHYQDFSQSKPSFPTDETSLQSYRSTKLSTRTYLIEHTFEQGSKDMLDAWNRWGQDRKGGTWGWEWPRLVGIQTITPQFSTIKQSQETVKNKHSNQNNLDNDSSPLRGDLAGFEDSDPTLAAGKISLDNRESANIASSAKITMRGGFEGGDEDLLDIWDQWGKEQRGAWGWNWGWPHLVDARSPQFGKPQALEAPTRPQEDQSLVFVEEGLRLNSPPAPPKTVNIIFSSATENSSKEPPFKDRSQSKTTPELSRTLREAHHHQDRYEERNIWTMNSKDDNVNAVDRLEGGRVGGRWLTNGACSPLDDHKSPIASTRLRNNGADENFENEMEDPFALWDRWGQDQKRGWSWGWPRLVKTTPQSAEGKNATERISSDQDATLATQGEHETGFEASPTSNVEHNAVGRPKHSPSPIDSSPKNEQARKEIQPQ